MKSFLFSLPPKKNGDENEKFFYLLPAKKTVVEIKFFIFSPRITGSENKRFLIFSLQKMVK